jgi:signal transduction histidine kinase
MFLYLLSISLWQIDISVLYLKDILSEDVTLFLFKLFRGATIYSISAIFYVIYTLIHKQEATLQKDGWINKAILSIFNQKGLLGLIVWSTFIYVISWSDYGVRSLDIKTVPHSPFEFYFPVYGSLNVLYKLHTSSLGLLLFLVYLVSKRIHNFHLRQFLRTFSMCSVFVFIPGLLNFFPETGILLSSAGVVIFSALIVLAFVRLHHHKAIQLHQILETQKKLDYTGNLAASLVHEVKNCTTIIKGYSKLMLSDKSDQEADASFLSFISLAADQLDELATSYRAYMKHQAIEFKMENLNAIIEQSIQLCRQFGHDHHVDIQFSKKYHHLRAYVNKSYLSQVIINLIKNGIESVPKDRENKTIMIETNITNDLIWIDVHDTGTGIPLSDWENIFDPFVSSKKEGMGLGLPFCKKIIFEHRGELKIIHSDETGTVFRIVLPQYEFTDMFEFKG